MTRLTGSLDANVLLRLLLNDVPAQHRAALGLLQRATGQLAVADIAVVEVVFVLQRAYGLTRNQVGEAVSGLLQLKELNCNRALFEHALPAYLKHSALSFEDCCLASYAELDNATPLWTFDKKLAHQTSAAQLANG